MDNKYGLSKNKWISIGAYATLGSLAWTIENSFLNFFIDRTITTNPFGITYIVAASSIVATITTLLAGIKSDRVGKRAPFIKNGYAVWGITIMLFSLIKVDYIQDIFGVSRSAAIVLAVIAVGIWDCVMTFFGSTANDAAFNAWVTDNTTTFNRSKTEGAITLFAALGGVMVFGIDLFGGMTYNTYYDANGNVVSNFVEGGSVKFGNWTLFFLILGGMVTAIGLAGRLFLKDSPDLRPNPQSTYANILYGFKRDVIRKNKMFYLALTATGIIGIAGMITSPYYIIYINRTLGYANYAIPTGISGALGVASAVIFGNIVDKKPNKMRYILPGLAAMVAGNITLFFSAPKFAGNGGIWVLFAGAAINGIGSAVIGNVLAAKIRDYTPSQNVGMFQGVRMTFNVLAPMILGPVATAIITTMNKANIIGYDEFGNAVYNYSSEMFLIAAAVLLLVLIPVFYLKKSDNPTEIKPDNVTR